MSATYGSEWGYGGGERVSPLPPIFLFKNLKRLEIGAANMAKIWRYMRSQLPHPPPKDGGRVGHPHVRSLLLASSSRIAIQRGATLGRGRSFITLGIIWLRGIRRKSGVDRISRREILRAKMGGFELLRGRLWAAFSDVRVKFGQFWGAIFGVFGCQQTARLSGPSFRVFIIFLTQVYEKC